MRRMNPKRNPELAWKCTTGQPRKAPLKEAPSVRKPGFSITPQTLASNEGLRSTGRICRLKRNLVLSKVVPVDAHKAKGRFAIVALDLRFIVSKKPGLSELEQHYDAP